MKEATSDLIINLPKFWQLIVSHTHLVNQGLSPCHPILQGTLPLFTGGVEAS